MPDALLSAAPPTTSSGSRLVREILSAPDMLGADEFALMAGLAAGELRRAVDAGEVLELPDAEAGPRYPMWQLTSERGRLPGLARISRRLGGDPWLVYGFLVAPHPALGWNSPVSALREGSTAIVLAACEEHRAYAIRMRGPPL
jgi:hypothetical protein